MSKLYFRYGAMGAGKSAQLLIVAHNYRDQGKEVLILKPALEDRDGQDMIKSRTQLSAKVDALLDPLDDVYCKIEPWLQRPREVQCILVDEAQFLSRKNVVWLRHITSANNIPVICYGLRTNFRGELFEGSKYLMALSDRIEEIKTVCLMCNKKATFNMRYSQRDHEGKPIPSLEGPELQLGGDDMYAPMCYDCLSYLGGAAGW